MIADPEGPSFITRTVGRRRYADDASVSHNPQQKSRSGGLPSVTVNLAKRTFSNS
jgi:hypothetical protein